ncbi:MAG TPA: hypothetical protein VMF30_06120 [Pirellulales bacterium]|nr:hypothetical protein [Pirellulales bacterium]
MDDLEQAIAGLPEHEPSAELDRRMDGMWIRMTGSAASYDAVETWFSLPLRISAVRRGMAGDEYFSFADEASGVKVEYNARTKKILRLPVRPHDAAELDSFAETFRAIQRGEAPSGDSFAGDRVVARAERTIAASGREWIEHEMRLERDPDGLQATLVIRVDAATHLPASMTISAPEGKLRFEIDYPTEGPADIYALGVPRDAAVDDRAPSGELAKILRTINANREGFDDYFAAIDEPERRVVWRRGNRWRIDFCPLYSEQPPGDPAQLAAWWRKYLAENQTTPSMVCDGKKVYYNKGKEQADGSWVGLPTKWKVIHYVRSGGRHSAASGPGNYNGALIEQSAYGELMAGPHATISFDPSGTGGPAGSVLVEVNHFAPGETVPDDSGFGTERYWLDPARGYVLLRREISNCPRIDRDPQQWPKQHVYEYDGFRQSPRGIWYPTVARWKNRHRWKDKEGNTHFEDSTEVYFLDFSAELPDELFTARGEHVRERFGAIRRFFGRIASRVVFALMRTWRALRAAARRRRG